MATEALIVMTTVADQQAADRLATALVERSLAACVSQLPGVQSVYRWQGSVEREEEVLLLIKTTRDAYPELAQALQELHEYELPELLAVPVVRGSPGYLEWLEEAAGSKE